MEGGYATVNIFLPEVSQSEHFVLEGLVNDFEQGVDINTLRNNFTQSKQRGDPDGLVIWAGTGIGLLNVSQPAKVRAIHVNREIEVYFTCRTLWKTFIRNVLASCAKRPPTYSERESNHPCIDDPIVSFFITYKLYTNLLLSCEKNMMHETTA